MAKTYIFEVAIDPSAITIPLFATFYFLPLLT